MRIATRFFSIVLLTVGLIAATTAGAGVPLYEASWTVKAFGNELTGGTGDEESYFAFGMPQGINCNKYQPRCPFDSTPTDGSGVFAILGGTQIGKSPFCAPWENWGGYGTSVRPAKGETRTNGAKSRRPIPPLYRNLKHFTSLGQPNHTYCTGATTGYTLDGKGRAQAGKPITGIGNAITTAAGAFTIPAANDNLGIKGTRSGSFAASYPYIYSYTYHDVRNVAGLFGPSSGPGSFEVNYKQGAQTVARVTVKQGANQFGGTMRMLGHTTALTCYYRQGGCSQIIGTANHWRYEVIGTSPPTGYPYTSGGVILKGYQVVSSQFWFNSGLGQTSTATLEGSRFPWTTGTVTVTAKGRGPVETVLYEHGYDNRATTPNGFAKGTIQMVSPTMTRWLQPSLKFETGGIAILKIKFVPEPHAWAILVAGAALLGVGYRMRRR